MATEEREPGAAEPKIGSRERPYSVTRVVRGVNQTLDRVVKTIWIEGEVSSLSRPSSGHLYFSLTDARAELRAVMWRKDADRLGFAIEEGMTLRARVRLGIYERDGKFQLYVQTAEPGGVGADAQALAALKAKLAAEGLFDPERKRSLPRIPRRIGVVTSKSGAAVRDIVRAVQRRFPVPILVADARVQGPTAARQIAHALAQLCKSDVDVVILGRGGGSAGDLSAFNDERVVRQIARCPIPVISAVGHEIDVTLSDLAADRRAATPTMAGEMAVPVLAELADALRKQERRLARELDHRFEVSRQELDVLSERLGRRVDAAIAQRRRSLTDLLGAVEARHPRAQISESRRALADLERSLGRSWSAAFAGRRTGLAASASKLHALSPLRVLERGYAIAQVDGHVIRDAAGVAPGDAVAVRLRRGLLGCRVESIEIDDEEE